MGMLFRRKHEHLMQRSWYNGLRLAGKQQLQHPRMLHQMLARHFILLFKNSVSKGVRHTNWICDADNVIGPPRVRLAAALKSASGAMTR
jgi:hypothetical protein